MVIRIDAIVTHACCRVLNAYYSPPWKDRIIDGQRAAVALLKARAACCGKSSEKAWPPVLYCGT